MRRARRAPNREQVVRVALQFRPRQKLGPGDVGAGQLFDVGLAIDRVNRLGFLTVEEKKDIFYDNAAKFLSLTAGEIARHHR